MYWTPERWRKAKEILGGAIELAGTDRDAFLDEACDGELRDKIAVLLSHHTDEPDDLERNVLERPGAVGFIDLLEGSEAPTYARLCAHPEPVQEADLVGALIDGKYRVDELLGKGGMGVVYRVQHLGLDKTFALKIVRGSREPGETFLDRFRTEAQAMGKLKHPHIVEVTDYGVDRDRGDMPYLVMEYLEGITLSEMQTEAEPPLERRLAILAQVAEAIDYAHRQGVLHGDLKPDNVFLSPSADAGHNARILDFGLARLEREKLEARPGASPETVVAGTPGFMAPELVEGSGPSTATDIYAFGVLVYELLVGKRPFEGNVPAVLSAQKNSPPPVPSREQLSIPAELDEPVLAALAKEPRARPASATAIVLDIRRGLRRAETREWRRREIPRRALLILLCSLVAAPASWLFGKVGLVEELEQRSLDWRFASAPVGPPDPRILLLSLDEATLQHDATPLADRANEFGSRLDRVFEAGAASVAIDLLLPSGWSRSEAFSRLILEHHERLTLAAFASPSGAVIGTECIRGLTASAIGPGPALELFGFVNVEPDADGVLRRGRSFYRDEEGKMRPTLAARATRFWTEGHSPPETYVVDHAVDWQILPKISWKDVDHRLDSEPELFEGKLVLVGADYAASGDDYHRIPSREAMPPAVSGLTLQALLAHTSLARWPFRKGSTLVEALLVAAMVSMASICGLFAPRLSWVLAGFSLLALTRVVVSALVFRSSHLVLDVTAPVLALAVMGGLLVAVRVKLPAHPEKAEKTEKAEKAVSS